jgi:hypothetical protein
MTRGLLKRFDIDPKSIILFCSLGNHFGAAANELKERFPGARLTAVAPLWRTEPLSKAGLIDNTIEVTKDRLHPIKNIGECMRVLAAVRGRRCDLFVTMYDSPALNLLHSLSAARRHSVFDVRGNLYAVRVSRFYPVGLLFHGAGRALLGLLTYAFISITLGSWRVLRRRR